MFEDIRDKAYITHDDVVGLNFIKASGPYLFRRHYRQGLRSHILEVIHKKDADCERTGLVVDGVRWYPKAKPVRMLRIFRTRLATLESALKEINRVKIIERFLSPDHMAVSSEFIADYVKNDGREILLCGLQAYEAGEIVDPWSILDPKTFVAVLYDRLRADINDLQITRDRWMALVRKKAATFINKIKQMVTQAGYIPDLAGIGNLIVVPAGEIKLVDINNISKVIFDSKIRLDDRGYPVCDKSIEALYLLEEKMTGIPVDKDEAIYRTFFDPVRTNAVKCHEENFYLKKKDKGGYPALPR